MDNDEALAALAPALDSAPSQRLRAARYLARNATPAQRRRLSQIREIEHNSWVRKALDQALKRSASSSSFTSLTNVDEVAETFLERHLQQELRAQAIEETSALFLHELRPLIGFLDGAAAGDISQYATSKTKTSVDRIRSFLDAIERLRKASAPPATQEFDLTDLVVRVAADEARQGRAILDNSNDSVQHDAGLHDSGEQEPTIAAVTLSLARQDPVMTTGDPALLEMALANGLRNAIEAVLEVSEGRRDDVILNWGVTDSDSWVVVLDQGCGLPSGSDRLAKPGTSTKSKSDGHLGMGLPIAQSAMESARGSIELMPRPNGGVSCEIRWPREG